MDKDGGGEQSLVLVYGKARASFCVIRMGVGGSRSFRRF